MKEMLVLISPSCFDISDVLLSRLEMKTVWFRDVPIVMGQGI